LLASIAIEHCYRNPGARVIFAAPTREQAKKILIPKIREILKDAPRLLVPEYKVQDRIYLFNNSSEINIDGADDDQGNHLRGTKATLILEDEAGFWRHFHYVTNSILLPQTITCNGRMIIASTPPKSVGHEFVGCVEEAIRNDSYEKQTVYDNPLLSPETIEQYAEDSKGIESTAFRREYLCEFVTEMEDAVVPEFNEQLHVITDYKRPDFYDCYVFMDLGLIDYTHVLFSYWNFEEAKIVIEDEVVCSFKTTNEIADLIKEKEAELWKWAPQQRVSDNEMQQLQDLAISHGLHFAPAMKYDKEAAINKLRKMFQDEKILISSKCKNLIFQLKVGIWNKSRTTFERIPGAGHLDGIDALKYGVRIVDYNKNPVPINHGASYQTHFNSDGNRTKHPLDKLVTWYGDRGHQ